MSVVIPPADRTEESTFDPSRYMIKVSGRDYLPVAARLRWFRSVHADWSIVTSPVEINREKQFAIFSAAVMNAEGRIIATGHKYEDIKGFGDYIEKAEKGAVGRALGMCGFGTDDIGDDDGDRLADAPSNRGRADGTTPMNRPPGTPRATETNGSGQEPIATEARKAFYKAALESGYDVNADGAKQCDGDKLFHVAYCAHKDNGVEITEKAVKSPKMWADATALLPAYTAKMAVKSPEPTDMSSLALDADPDPVNYTTEQPRGRGSRR